MKQLNTALALFVLVNTALCQQNDNTLKILALYTGRADLAHISFVNEAKKELPKIAALNKFQIELSDNWTQLNTKDLTRYHLIMLLDTRPELPAQRAAFRKYLDNGGACIIFHFAGFALTPSDFPQNWSWYHDTLIASGQYKGNTWKPTPATLKNEKPSHPVLKNLPQQFRSAANEWYSWEKDIRNNPDIEILLSIDSSSFPLGTGPKQHEIWHEGYYPVAWTNKKYRMVYINMGHNDMDYIGGTNATLSSQFSSPDQNQFLLNAIQWLLRPGKESK
jgi:hypothetical protein